MNREIKFRAWDKKQKRWANLQLSEMEFTRDGLLRVGETIEYGTHAEFNDFELMQYTGLKDKNVEQSQDIYECDIIDSTGKVKGNIYESPQIYEEGVDLLIAGMGTSAWRDTESIAVGRGCFYAEQQPVPTAVRQLVEGIEGGGAASQDSHDLASVSRKNDSSPSGKAILPLEGRSN